MIWITIMHYTKFYATDLNYTNSLYERTSNPTFALVFGMPSQNTWNIKSWRYLEWNEKNRETHLQFKLVKLAQSNLHKMFALYKKDIQTLISLSGSAQWESYRARYSVHAPSLLKVKLYNINNI